MEIDVLKWFATTFHSQGWLNYIMKYITFLGEFAAVPIVCALVLLIFKRTRKAGLSGAIGLIADVLIVNVILKLAVNRARPWTEFEEITAFYEQYGIRLPTDSSFPSGHTAACFCIAVVLTCKYKAKGAPALFVALLVAVSRIYLCVHYPTDVLAGALIGSACGVAGHFAGEALYPCVERLLQKFSSKLGRGEGAGGETAGSEEVGKEDEDGLQ